MKHTTTFLSIVSTMILIITLGIFSINATTSIGQTSSGGSGGGGGSSSPGLTDNFGISSGMYLPDKGVNWYTYFRNSNGSANAHLSTGVFNNGECGHYFVPTDTSFNIYPSYFSENGEGIRKFYYSTTYLITDKAPAKEEFEYSFEQEYGDNYSEIRVRGTISNGYDYLWPDKDENNEDAFVDPIRIVTTDINTWLSIYIDSPTAKIYNIDCQVNERNYSWEDQRYLEVYMNGTIHTPEPASMILLGLGAITLIRRRRNTPASKPSVRLTPD